MVIGVKTDISNISNWHHIWLNQGVHLKLKHSPLCCSKPAWLVKHKRHFCPYRETKTTSLDPIECMDRNIFLKYHLSVPQKKVIGLKQHENEKMMRDYCPFKTLGLAAIFWPRNMLLTVCAGGMYFTSLYFSLRIIKNACSKMLCTTVILTFF